MLDISAIIWQQSWHVSFPVWHFPDRSIGSSSMGIVKAMIEFHNRFGVYSQWCRVITETALYLWHASVSSTRHGRLAPIYRVPVIMDFISRQTCQMTGEQRRIRLQLHTTLDRSWVPAFQCFKYKLLEWCSASESVRMDKCMILILIFRWLDLRVMCSKSHITHSEQTLVRIVETVMH